MSRGLVKAFTVISLGFLNSLFSAATPLKVSVSAKSAILMNADTGHVLYEKKGFEAWHPASTTKVFTALYALEKKGSCLQAPITASPNAIATVSKHVRRNSSHPPYRLEFGGTHMSLHAGEVLPFETLLYGLMLASANDAANVIAEYVSGSCEDFMEELNLFVKKKGCAHTDLFTPHGMPHPDHKTTAYDLAQFMREALKNATFRKLIQATEYLRPSYGNEKSHLMIQHNALVRKGRFYYPHTIGGKTGYTDWSGYTIVAAAEHQGRTLIVVLFGCETIAERYRDAINLFEAGFQEAATERVLLASDFEKFETQVEGGKLPLLAHLQKDLKIRYYPSEEPAVSIQIQWDPPRFPIQEGTRVGKVLVMAQNQVIQEEPLFASILVESTWRHELWLHIKLVQKLIRTHLSILLSLLGAFILGMTFYLFHSKKGRVI